MFDTDRTSKTLCRSLHGKAAQESFNKHAAQWSGALLICEMQLAHAIGKQNYGEFSLVPIERGPRRQRGHKDPPGPVRAHERP